MPQIIEILVVWGIYKAERSRGMITFFAIFGACVVSLIVCAIAVFVFSWISAGTIDSIDADEVGVSACIVLGIVAIIMSVIFVTFKTSPESYGYTKVIEVEVEE